MSQDLAIAFPASWDDVRRAFELEGITAVGDGFRLAGALLAGGEAATTRMREISAAGPTPPPGPEAIAAGVRAFRDELRNDPFWRRRGPAPGLLEPPPSS